MAIQYLFRYDQSNIFLSPEDPEANYQLVCGNCHYPVKREVSPCPRCQRELDFCPICTEETGRRPLATSASSRCSVCGFERLATGDLGREGRYCSNLYGCPAGGMLMLNEEAVVLPDKNRICPICEDTKLTPLKVIGFRDHLRSCIFCATLFERSPGWPRDWNLTTRGLYTPDVDGLTRRPCKICGRNDYVNEDGEIALGATVLPEHAPETMSIGAYLRLVELGRVIALYPSDEEAFNQIYELWHNPTDEKPSRSQSISLAELFDFLERGTQTVAVQRWIQKRSDNLTLACKNDFRDGLQHRVEYTGGQTEG